MQPTASYRSRIAAHKSALTAVAPVLATVALATIANTAGAVQLPPTVSQYTVFTYSCAGSGDSVAFDPLSGSFSGGAGVSSFLPLAVAPFEVGGFAYADSGSNVVFLGNCGAASPSAGDVLDGSDTFESGSGSWIPGANNDGSTLNYLGFRFTGYGEGFDETYYGWVEYRLNETFIEVLRTGVGPDNTAVVVGAAVAAIPEPSSVAALIGSLALGATFAIRRRRR